MLNLGLLGLFCFRMTAKTKIAVLGQEKFLVLCRMGGMAGQASPFVVQGRMPDADMRLLVDMTLETDLVAGLGQQHLVFRGMRVMAGEAGAGLEGLMTYRAAL